MEILELNHTYLIKDKIFTSGTIKSITILLITKTAYQIQWHNDISDGTTWELIGEFLDNYKIIEDITGLVNFNQPKIMMVNCENCNGNGMIKTDKNTAGQELCPVCYGSKVIHT